MILTHNETKLPWPETFLAGSSIAPAKVSLHGAIAMGKFIDLTGRSFGRLKVLHRECNDKHSKACWACQCDCGNTTIVSASDLSRGHTRSCGCLVGEARVKRSCIDLTGRKVGRLQVLHKEGRDKAGRIMWACRCACGEITVIRSDSLIAEKTLSCGCLVSEPHLPSLVGQTFGRLTVLRKDAVLERGAATWVCQCTCGKIAIVRQLNLRNGNTRSCGCYQAETRRIANRKHGKSTTREYRTWDGIKKRCRDPKQHNYKYYGGRGIKVCDRWLHSFENFLEDMGPKPTPYRSYSIDRINPNGDYAPDNCRWATAAEQERNKRRLLTELDIKNIKVLLANSNLTDAQIATEFNSGMIKRS